MIEDFDAWRLLAGLGLFLFGMRELELALQQLAGRTFKQFLREHTEHPLKGVLSGAVATAVLQSSSVVSLIVLAFIGSGVISLASAVAIVFGSNLGTTATGWIVASIGFKLDIEMLALPLVGIGGLGIVWLKRGARFSGLSHLSVGFGLMLLGLEFMKSGSASVAGLFDPAALQAYPPLVFLLVGFLLTAAIQSSSATIMITLSALYAGVIPLASAAAVAIGADLGTTITALLGAVAGSIAKRRVAAAIVLFNVVTDAIAFAMLPMLLRLITDVFGLSDPLMAVVAFHSLFNLIGLIIFLPLIPFLSRQLAQRIGGKESLLQHTFTEGESKLPDIAIDNLGGETLRVIDQAAAFNQSSFDIEPVHTFYDSADDRFGVPVFTTGADINSVYADLKRLEGQILGFSMKIQRQGLEPNEAARLSQIMVAIRNAVHSAKNIKDLHHDLASFQKSPDDHFHAFYGLFRESAEEFYKMLDGLKVAATESLRFEKLVELKNCNESLHAALHARIFGGVEEEFLKEAQVSTLLNVNREFYLSNRSLLIAVAFALLGDASARDYESLPSVV